jgi:hypothetical protein
MRQNWQQLTQSLEGKAILCVRSQLSNRQCIRFCLGFALINVIIMIRERTENG